MPLRPMYHAGASSQPMRWAAIEAPPTSMLQVSQISAPAGAANVSARHNTISVRSMSEV